MGIVFHAKSLKGVKINIGREKAGRGGRTADKKVKFELLSPPLYSINRFVLILRDSSSECLTTREVNPDPNPNPKD